MLNKNDRVEVSNPLIGLVGFKGMHGKVIRTDKEGWIWVSLLEASDKEPVPFRERELVKTN